LFILCKGHGAYKLQNQILVLLASMLNVSNNGESMRLSLLISTKLSSSQHNEVGTWLIHFANIWLMYLSILNVYVLNDIPLHFPTWVWILLEPCNGRQWGGKTMSIACIQKMPQKSFYNYAIMWITTHHSKMCECLCHLFMWLCTTKALIA
jgi:hypothetical protein